MKNQDKQGFTLIELLVVVLIIGILAAVALPQYQKAVEKSKSMQAITLLQAVYAAAQHYQLTNGAWPTSFDELDVQIPWTDTTKWKKSSLDSRSNGEWTIELIDDVYYTGVMIGRISGPNAGAGFSMWSKFYSAYIPKHKLLCVETHGGGYYTPHFKKTTGDYCTQLFAGKKYNTNDSAAQFSMP